jgi:hypothetical protein
MLTTDPSHEGFTHRGRIIYSVQYRYMTGATQIFWLDRSRKRNIQSDRAGVTRYHGSTCTCRRQGSCGVLLVPLLKIGVSK